MSTYRIAWIFLICLINEISAHDEVSDAGLKTRPEEIVHTDKTSRAVLGASVKAAKEIGILLHKNLLTSIEINIENLLTHKLMRFQGITLTGKQENPKLDIPPKEIISVKARSGTVKFFTGTSGVVSWEIEGQNVRIIVMWRLNAFKTNDSQKNTLWIALTPGNSFEIRNWGKYVENDAEFPSDCSCKKGIFTSGKPMKELIITHGPFKLQGILGTSKHPTANIIVSFTKETS